MTNEKKIDMYKIEEVGEASKKEISDYLKSQKKEIFDIYKNIAKKQKTTVSLPQQETFSWEVIAEGDNVTSYPNGRYSIENKGIETLFSSEGKEIAKGDSVYSYADGRYKVIKEQDSSNYTNTLFSHEGKEIAKATLGICTFPNGKYITNNNGINRLFSSEGKKLAQNSGGIGVLDNGRILKLSEKEGGIEYFSNNIYSIKTNNPHNMNQLTLYSPEGRAIAKGNLVYEYSPNLFLVTTALSFNENVERLYRIFKEEDKKIQ